MLDSMWKKGNPPALLVGMYIDNTTMKQSIGEFLKKLQIELSYGPAIPLLGIHPEKTIIREDICILNIHCSTIYNSWDMEAT